MKFLASAVRYPTSGQIQVLLGAVTRSSVWMVSPSHDPEVNLSSPCGREAEFVK